MRQGLVTRPLILHPGEYSVGDNEAARVELEDRFNDKERELRNHKDAEESRIVTYVKDAGQDPNVLLDSGLESAIKEVLAALKRILKEGF